MQSLTELYKIGRGPSSSHTMGPERAINAISLASFLWDSRVISFDKVVKTMKATGHDLSSLCKETSEAGLAKIEI